MSETEKKIKPPKDAPPPDARPKVNMLAPVGSKRDLQLMLERKRDGIVALVGDARIKRFTSIMLAMTNRHPELLECTMDSVLNAIQHCALIGLMPGPRGEIYLIPFKNKKLKGKKEISVIHGYKGLMRLGLQHKSVANVEAECVYEGDEFDFDAGERKIHHRYPPDADHDPEKIIGAWSQVWFKDNPRPSVLYYNKEQLDAKRKKSKQPTGNFWRDNPAAMYRKTVIRGHYNGGEIPMTDELSAAMDRELEEEFKDADVVSVTSAAPGSGVAAAKAAIGMGPKEDEVYEPDETDGFHRGPEDGRVWDGTAWVPATDDEDGNAVGDGLNELDKEERKQRTLDEDEQFMVQQIHEKLQVLDGDGHEETLAKILDDVGARNLAECSFRELVIIRDGVKKRFEEEAKD